jgi:hypothetical protein
MSIWIYSGAPRHGKCRSMFWLLSIFYGHLVYIKPFVIY